MTMLRCAWVGITLLENMALQDLEYGNGFALIDRHGELASRIAARVPQSRRTDVLYLDASDPSQPYGYIPCAMCAKIGSR
jgi:hypothetical protein